MRIKELQNQFRFVKFHVFFLFFYICLGWGGGGVEKCHIGEVWRDSSFFLLFFNKNTSGFSKISEKRFI